MVVHPSNPSFPRGSSIPSPLTEPPALPPDPVIDLTDAAAARIIRELAEPSASLDSVAQANGLAVADLALWLTTPAARERMLAIEGGGYAHVRMAASLKLSHAVGALLRVLDTFNALAASRPASEPLVIRAAIHANKAAYHLYRLSRIMPIDEAQRPRAHHGIRAARTIATQVSNSIQPQTHFQTPPQPQPQTQPAPTPAPAGRPIIAHDTAPLPQPATQTSVSRNPAHVPGSAPEVPRDISQLLSQLTALATSLGIDITDLEDPGPDLEPHPLLHASPPLALADTT